MKTLSVGVVSLFLELAAVEACACDCVRPPSPQARFDEAKVVFSGRVRETCADAARG
jgi:hypothetical protein